MRPELFTIRRAGPGLLSTMAHPYGGDWLDEAMRGLAEAGIGMLASLLTDDEMAELELTAEAEAAAEAGIAFYRLPTPDRQVPDLTAGLALAGTLREHLGQDAGVAIHCRFGIGRSSTLAAMVMVLEGTHPEQALAMISAARGRIVPDTGPQRDAVLRLQVPGVLVQDSPDPAHP